MLVKNCSPEPLNFAPFRTGSTSLRGAPLSSKPSLTVFTLSNKSWPVQPGDDWMGGPPQTTWMNYQHSTPETNRVMPVLIGSNSNRLKAHSGRSATDCYASVRVDVIQKHGEGSMKCNTQRCCGRMHESPESVCKCALIPKIPQQQQQTHLDDKTNHTQISYFFSHALPD
jgi:hypothetical protein